MKKIRPELDIEGRRKLMNRAADRILDDKLRKTCHFIVATQDAFLIAPAACSKHQAYTGGLVDDHTLEVLQIAMATACAPPLMS